MINRLLKFLDASPVNFLAARNIACELEQNGYRRLDPQQPLGELKAGDKVYVTKNDSSVYAFRLGRKPLAETGFHMICAHSDSPTFRVTSEDGIFPTIFKLLRDKDPDAEIGAFYEWDGIKYLIDTLAMSRYETVPQDQLSDSARNYILTKKPKLAAFVFDDPDHVGHAIGHDTEALYAKLTQLDGWIGEILDAIEQAGIMDKSIIILTSDHGGIGKGHGGRTMEEMETPFVIYGKGVRKGYCFDDISVMQFDVASTMAYIFNLKQPQAWFGRPVKSIFK